MSQVCLGCICEAVSNCQTSLKCEGDVCGVFRITQPYWVDAGKPVLLNDDPNSPSGKQNKFLFQNLFFEMSYNDT